MMRENLFRPTGFNSVVAARYGYMIYNRHDQYVGRSIEEYGEYSEQEVAMFRQLCREGDVVVDAGANIGAHTLALSRLVGRFGRIFAFEPQRMVFQTLCGNMAINSVQNVECFQIGLSSKSGTMSVPDISYDQPSNFGGFGLSDHCPGNGKVPVATLDSVLDVPGLRLLKVDVEGMEYEVLSGARRLIETYRPVMYVENDRVDKSKRLIEFVRSLDYRMFWHLPLLFNPDNFFGRHEDVFNGTASCNMLCVHNSVSINFINACEVTDSDPAMHPVARLRENGVVY